MEWTPELAYAVGLITTDGSLSSDGRHINLTSKDIDQIKNFAEILSLKNKIELKKSSYNPNGTYYQIQFGNVRLYRFLQEIGLFPNKSKSLGALKIPRKYFADFLRGHLDGDGFTYSYWDKRWKSSFMLYTGFISASYNHVEWIKAKIEKEYDLKGNIRKANRSFQLLYAKKSSVILLKKIYYKDDLPSLQRKQFKISQALGIIERQADVLKLVDRHA